MIKAFARIPASADAGKSKITSFPVTCAAEMTLIAPTANLFCKKKIGSWGASLLTKEACGLFGDD